MGTTDVVRQKILFQFLKLGFVPDWSRLLTLPRRVGLVGAGRVPTACTPLSGAQAFACGLADQLAPGTGAMAAAIDKTVARR